MKKILAAIVLSLALFASAVHAAPVVDINTATIEQLQTVKGIGPAYAALIIKNRPATGYTGSQQVVTIAGLPKALYAQVKDQLVAKKVKK